MLIWKNTNTLDGLIDGFPTTESKPKAEIALLGSKPINLDEFPKRPRQGVIRPGVRRKNHSVAGFPDAHSQIRIKAAKNVFALHSDLDENLSSKGNASVTGKVARCHLFDEGHLKPGELASRHFLKPVGLLRRKNGGPHHR